MEPEDITVGADALRTLGKRCALSVHAHSPARFDSRAGATDAIQSSEGRPSRRLLRRAACVLAPDARLMITRLEQGTDVRVVDACRRASVFVSLRREEDTLHLGPVHDVDPFLTRCFDVMGEAVPSLRLRHSRMSATELYRRVRGLEVSEGLESRVEALAKAEPPPTDPLGQSVGVVEDEALPATTVWALMALHFDRDAVRRNVAFVFTHAERSLWVDVHAERGAPTEKDANFPVLLRRWASRK